MHVNSIYECTVLEKFRICLCGQSDNLSYHHDRAYFMEDSILESIPDDLWSYSVLEFEGSRINPCRREPVRTPHLTSQPALSE
jgi:hypothetical protein